MNLDFFIAKRLIKSGDDKNKISSPIIKIAISAIAIGVVIMFISMASGFGLQNKIREKISAFSGHILINNYDNNQSGLTLDSIVIDSTFYRNFKNIDGIKNIQAYATIGGIIRTEKNFEGIIFKGVDQNYNWDLFKPYLIEGYMPKFSEKRNKNVLISKTLSNRLGLKINDSFNTFFLRKNSNKPQLRIFKISGIYDTGFEDFDKNYVIGDLKIVQGLYRWPKNAVGGFEVILQNFDEIDGKTIAIEQETPPTLYAQSIMDKYPFIFNWLQMFDFNILLILVIIIFVAGLNMITTLLVMIMEKRQFIAIMKVLGSNNRKLQRIFLLQAVYVIGIGLLIGNFIGLGLIFLQKQFGLIQLNPATYYVKIAPAYINLKHILLLNTGVMIAILIMLLLPVLFISRISPVKVLHYD